MAENFTRTPAGLQRAGRPVTARIPGMSPQQGEINEASPQEGGPQESGEERLTRVSRRQDKFYVDPRVIPDGWSYEWKRMSVYGQPDPDHMLNLKANHWRPVPLARHQNLMPGQTDSGHIVKDGMILMERPLYLTLDAQQEDYDIAVDQVRKKEQQVGEAPVGTFDRRGNPTLDRTTGIRKSYRPLTAED